MSRYFVMNLKNGKIIPKDIQYSIVQCYNLALYIMSTLDPI
jgi:hypothetical protein